MEKTVQLSTPLPRSLDSRIYVRVIIKSKAVMVFVTTASAEEMGTPSPLGSFVYALPDRFNPNQPISTPLVTVEPTLDFTTRLAKLVVKKTQLPTYVGNSLSLAGTGLGGAMEEEMEAFKAVAELVLPQLQHHHADAAPNGITANS